MPTTISLAAAASLLAVSAAPAPDAPPATPAPASEPLVADRPDFTEATDTVDPFRLQFEGGYTFTLFDDDAEEHTAPEALLRFGIHERFELRFEWPGWVWARDAAGDDSDGHNDIGFGFKVAFCEQDGLLPALSLLARTSAPTGEPGIGADDWEPEAKLLWSYDLTDRLSLSGNVNLAAPISDRGRYWEPAASVSLGIGLTEQLGMYVEYFGLYPVDRGGGPQHNVNTGLTFLVTNDLQFDVRIGAGLSDAAPDMFVGAGLAVRF